MSGKNQAPQVINWQSTNPLLNFLPLNQLTINKGSVPSGVVNGVMTGTTTIYTNVIDVSRMDNLGISYQWTGTPTGTFQVMGNNDGILGNEFALTFNPLLIQPAGSANSAIGIDLNQFPWKWLFLQYTNVSGSGLLYATLQVKDLN